MYSHEYMHLLEYLKWEVFLLLAAGFLLLLRRWRLALLFPVCASLIFFSKIFGINTAIPGATDLSVVSYSLRSKNPQQLTDLKRVIESEKPDVALFQEVHLTPEIEHEVVQYGYRICAFSGKAGIILSKEGFDECEILGNVLSANIKKYKDIQIFNIHAPKFFVDSHDYNDFFRDVINTAERSNGPVVIGGDFNSLVTSTWRKKLRALGYSSSIDEYGDGFKATFPAYGRRLGWLPPFLAIDDIYVKGQGIVTSKVLYGRSGSDHFAIISHLKNIKQGIGGIGAEE